MPVIKGKGFPDDHPFKGTCIIFGFKRPKPVEESLPREKPPLSSENHNIPEKKDQK